MRFDSFGQTDDGFFYICDQCGEHGPQTIVWKELDDDRSHFAICKKCLEAVFIEHCEYSWYQEIKVKRKVISEELRNEVFKRDGNVCRWCGATEDLVIDHAFPFSRGGKTEIENLQTLCRSCNIKKGSKLVEDGWCKK